jgi:hypothetical protein
MTQSMGLPRVWRSLKTDATPRSTLRREKVGAFLPFAARAPPRPSFPVGAFACACSIVDPRVFSSPALAYNRAIG